jgi:uncharacterized tellurite resistance protein B-like protein
MLNKLKGMIERLTEPDDSAETRFSDHKLAAAALLVHATHIDGDTDLTEQDKLKDLLKNHYQLEEQDVLALIRLAEREENQAVDLYGFTRRLSQNLEPEERLKIIEMLWEVAFSDGVLHEFESNLIWRVAELMHVPSRERIRLRKEVESRLPPS